jgi:hypothetical protein
MIESIKEYGYDTAKELAILELSKNINNYNNKDELSNIINFLYKNLKMFNKSNIKIDLDHLYDIIDDKSDEYLGSLKILK